MALPRALGFPLELFSDLVSVVALFYEFIEFFVVLLAILIIFVGVVGLEAD